HRADGGLPSGNSKNTNGIDVIAKSGIQLPNHATTVAPGSDPDEAKRAYTTYVSRKPNSTTPNAIAENSQPIGFRGWRVAINAPTVANPVIPIRIAVLNQSGGSTPWLSNPSTTASTSNPLVRSHQP